MKLAINIGDLRREAKRRIPKFIFDFVDGGAEDEVTLKDNRDQFARWKLIARNPVDVSARDLSVELFGQRFAAPFVISPTGLASAARGRAEVALARAAHRLGVPIAVSTASSVDIEDLAACAGGPLWFQLYILKDRGLTQTLIDRARAAGYKAIVISVDCPVVGQRERDARNRLSVPFRPTFAQMIDVLGRTGWLLDFLKHGPPAPRNFAALGQNADEITLKLFELLDPAVSWADIAWVRERWDGPLIIKGLVSPVDAKLALSHGADGLVVSNQGGRQLDHAVPSLEALPYINDAVGDRCTLFCDSGFRRGGDIVKALALGAKAVFLGRATLFGCAAGGEEGAFRALTILRDELDRVLAFVGRTSPADIDRSILWDYRQGSPGQGPGLATDSGAGAPEDHAQSV